MLGDDRPSSLDCLALGYLALALVPSLPQPWLADTLEAKYAPLCRYVRDSMQAVGGMDVRLEDALLGPLNPDTERGGEFTDDTTSTRKGLPWRQPASKTFTSAAAVFLDHALNSLPFRSPPVILQPTASNTDSTPQSQPHSQPEPPSLLPYLFSLGAAALAVTGYILFAGSAQEEKSRNLADMGEAGAMLAMASFGEDVREAQIERELERGGQGKVGVVEVDVEVEDRRGKDIIATS